MPRTLKATAYDRTALAFLLAGLMLLSGLALLRPAPQGGTPSAADLVFLR